MCEGNFKCMKKKRVVKDPPTSTEEKVVKKSAFFGCGVAVKALRVGFEKVITQHTDVLFTSRLMRAAVQTYQMDQLGELSEKSIFFSRHRWFLSKIEFDIKGKDLDMFMHKFDFAYSESRVEATLILNEFQIKGINFPKGATHYQFVHHLCIISDYVYSKISQKYEPLSELSGMNASVCSEKIPVGDIFTGSLPVSFPEGTVLSDADSVIQSVGVNFLIRSGPGGFMYIRGGGIKIVDVY